MATKIRRCLYIGLGGTGMNALLNTKKMFIETYGEVPKMIGFLGVDTDGGVYNKSLIASTGEEITLAPNEQFPIQVSNPADIYRTNIDHFSWVPEENITTMVSMTNGAGQIRTNGRFALTWKVSELENKITGKLNAITNASIQDNGKYALSSEDIDIHIVFSVCGGTGAGTFINTAYLCKQLCKNQNLKASIIGYGVLADVFHAALSVGVSRVRPNAYASIQDLDFLMHLKETDNYGISFDYLNHVYNVKERPFDAVFLVDNKNDNGDTYNKVDDLTKMISLALITSSGELSSASASVMDNLKNDIRQSTMDVQGKKAWVSGLGVCEIVYSGENLAEIYAKKAAQKLIEKMLNTSIDASNIANGWIDSPDVHIRENQNCDFVIDYLLPERPQPMSEIEDKDAPQAECENHIAFVTRFSDLDDRLKEKTRKVKESLGELVIENVNKEGGIAGTLKIIASIKDQVNIFLDEMRGEKEEYGAKETSLSAEYQQKVEDLREASGKTINKLFGSKIKEAKSDLIDAVAYLCIARWEIKRREYAIMLFNDLKNALDDHESKIKALESIARNIDEELRVEIARVENNVGQQASLFRIDVGTQQVNVADTDIMFNELINRLQTSHKLYDYATMPKEEFKGTLLAYAQGLNGCKQYLNCSIEDVIEKLPEDEFVRLMERALNKSKVLLPYNNSYAVAARPADCYYIGVADKDHCRMNRGNALKDQAGAHVGNLDFASIGMKNRIIFFHQFGVIPAFQVSSVNTYKTEYEALTSTDCHFDKNIEVIMERSNYSLMPTEKEDDSIKLWMIGFVLGLIKNENNQYLVKNDTLGDMLLGGWFALGQYRDEAFENFKKNLATIGPEIEYAFNLYQEKNGSDAYKALIEDAAQDRNYLEKYSQINLTDAQIRAHGNQRVYELIDKEIRAIKGHARNL